MSRDLRLVLFDVDGTLVDSQGCIVAAMQAAFAAARLAAPDRRQILSVVGLSLPQAISRLVPEQPDRIRALMVEAYRSAYHAHRLEQGAAAASPLFPGARAILDALAATPDTLLGVATGKSRRGLDALIEAHGLERHFVTRQVSDHHPSKPHPSMIEAAIAETGVDPAMTVMIGDTSFDMDMARAAGVAGIGVSWGYHAPSALQGKAHRVIDRIADLPATVNDILKAPA